MLSYTGMHSSELVKVAIMMIRKQMRHLGRGSLFPFSHSTFPAVRPKPQTCVTEELIKLHKCVCAIWGSYVFLCFLFLTVCERGASQYSRHSVSDQIWPLFLALIADYFCTAHMIPRGLYMGLATWTVVMRMSVHSAHSPVFLFASLLWTKHMLACFHSMCFLFSSQQLRGWRAGILAVCGVCSNRRNSSTGSLSSSCLTPLSSARLTMS